MALLPNKIELPGLKTVGDFFNPNASKTVTIGKGIPHFAQIPYYAKERS